MEFKTDIQIEIQRNCNIARIKDIGMKNADFEMYKAGWEDFKRMIYEPIRESQKPETGDEALPITDVVGQSEQLVCGFCGGTENTEEIPVCNNCWDRFNNH